MKVYFGTFSYTLWIICCMICDLDSGRIGMLGGMRNVVQDGEIRELGSSDDEGWQEKEASRTHSVKFTDEPPETDKEVSTLHMRKSSRLFRFAISKFRVFSRYLMCWKRYYSYDSLY